MAARTSPAARDTVPGTIGALEKAAGLPGDAGSRFDFWIRFKDAPDPITAGVAALRARISMETSEETV
ncbi:MAG: hypothetical protein AAGH68_02305 [Pseudomonadota bacterium]